MSFACMFVMDPFINVGYIYSLGNLEKFLFVDWCKTKQSIKNICGKTWKEVNKHVCQNEGASSKFYYMLAKIHMQTLWKKPKVITQWKKQL
jgi:hypothetical protein